MMINVEKIKSLILEIAVKGKLVCNSESEDFNVQFIQISQTKKEITKKYKSKKRPLIQKVYEVPYSIPNNWKWIRLGEIVEIFGRIGFRGYTKDDLVEKGCGAITLSPSNIINGKFDYSNCTYISWEKYFESPEIMVEDGDVILCKTASVGKVARAIDLPEKATINPQFVIFKDVQCNAEYLNYLLASPASQRQFADFTCGTSIPTFSQERLANLLCAIPPLEEQKRIVAKLDEIFSELDKVEGNQNNLVDIQDKLQSKILKLAIQGKLVEQRPEEGTAIELLKKSNKYYDILMKTDAPFNIPENWEWIKLGNVMDIERGGSPRPIKSYITNDSNGINWIKIGDVDKGGKYICSTAQKIKPEGEKKSRKVYPGDFLLTNSMSFGRPYISKIEGCIHDGWLLLRNKYNVFDLDYLYLLLSSSFAYEQFSQKASGATVDNLNKDKVFNLSIPLPPLKEQKRIVEKVNEIISYINID